VDPKRGITPEIDLNSVDSQMTVSRQHARIRYDKSAFTIEDLKSRNKTRLRGLTLSPLQPEPLRDGDVVHFGSVRMVFRVAGAKDATIVR
ncbi:MAG TPA: FHA domain-containing protein, partial [Ktedonobacteraceae bacterium]